MIADGLLIVAIYTWLRLLTLWSPLDHEHDGAQMSRWQMTMRIMIFIGMFVIAIAGFNILLAGMSGTPAVNVPSLNR